MQKTYFEFFVYSFRNRNCLTFRKLNRNEVELCKLSSVNFRAILNVGLDAILKPPFRVTIETANT